MEVKKCPICGSEMRWIPPGISPRTGNAYEGFWSCPNRCPKSSKSQRGQQMILDELAKINERLDKLAEYLKKKFD